MQVRRVSVSEAVGHILMHNVVDAEGRRVARKGTRITPEVAERLREVGITQLMVVILEADDVHEDNAARQLAEALLTPELYVTWGVGGRANLHSEVLGVAYIDTARLEQFNLLPGLTLATVPPYSVVRPEEHRGLVATLKVIPFAIPRSVLEEGIQLAAERPGIIEVQPLRSAQVALMLTGHPAALPRLKGQFEPPTRHRLERLGSVLTTVRLVPQDEESIAEEAATLLEDHDMLIISGQTSVMDLEDITLRALRAIGAEVTVHGAPVDPGNLLALAYLGSKPIMAAPGCARSLAHNVVDLVLPRLLVGERLTQREIAALGAGGLLHARSEDAVSPG